MSNEPATEDVVRVRQPERGDIAVRNYASLADALAASDPRTERPFRCHHHDDHQASASVNMIKGLYYCYACHAKGKVEHFYPDEDLDHEYILELLTERPSLPEGILQLYTQSRHPYWQSRFTEATIDHFQLGYDYVRERPCYPIRDVRGSLLGVVHRNLDPGGPKYRYPTGVEKSHLLFNYTPAQRDVVVLVEGAMDVAAAWEVGHEAFGIYGSRMSVHQRDLALRCEPQLVVLAFDNDRAGKECTVQALGLLSDVRTVVAELGEYKDLAELPEKERKTLLDSLAIS